MLALYPIMTVDVRMVAAGVSLLFLSSLLFLQTGLGAGVSAFLAVLAAAGVTTAVVRAAVTGRAV